jgi:CHASE2 domain-containing sensor protein
MNKAHRHRWFTGIGLLIWIIFLVQHISVLQGHEIASLDYFSRLHPPRPLADSKIVMVSITEDDYHKIGGDQPLAPEKILEAVNVIASANPAVIAVDLDTSSPSYAQALVGPRKGDTPKRYKYLDENKVSIVWAGEARDPGESFGSHRSFEQGKVIERPTVLGGAQSAPCLWRVGVSNLFTDGNRVRRYTWSFPTADGEPADSFSLAILRALRKGDALCEGDRVCKVDTSNVAKDLCNDACIGLLKKCCDPDRPCLRPVFFRFSMSNPQPNVSFGDLFKFGTQLDPKVEHPVLDWQEEFKDKIVFVGAEYPQAAPPVLSVAGQLYPVRIHAEALAAALDQDDGLIWVRRLWQVVCAELIALSSLFFLQHWIRSTRWRILVTFLGVFLLSTLLSWVAFASFQFFVNFLPLLCGVFLDVLKDALKAVEARKVAAAT